MNIDIRLAPSDLTALGVPHNRVRLTKFRLSADGRWLELSPLDPERPLYVKRALLVGTIGNRHSGMQADLYLAQQIIPGQSGFDLIYKRAYRLCTQFPGAEVHLMYSGLTEATVAAVLAFVAAKQNFKLLRFDRRSKSYIPLDLSQFWKDIK